MRFKDKCAEKDVTDVAIGFWEVLGPGKLPSCLSLLQLKNKKPKATRGKEEIVCNARKRCMVPKFESSENVKSKNSFRRRGQPQTKTHSASEQCQRRATVSFERAVDKLPNTNSDSKVGLGQHDGEKQERDMSGFLFALCYFLAQVSYSSDLCNSSLFQSSWKYKKKVFCFTNCSSIPCFHF